jgi:nucleoid-associated protein YgaU
MPPEMQKAVAGALTTEPDPAKLEGFASAIQAQYPIAAGLLMAKAQALRFAQLPHSLPIPVVPPAPSPPVPVSPRPQVPSGGGGITPFPASGTYVVISGDYPIKITQKFTGNGNRWKELIAANPDKPTRADGAWTTLMPGEIVKLPQAWNTNVSAKAPSLALPPAGGTHAANA